MYISMIILALIYVICGGAVMPGLENAQQDSSAPSPSQHQPNQPSESLQANSPIATYPVNQGNQPSPTPLYYPTYPEYTKLGYSSQPGYNRYSPSVKPSFQKSPEYSPGLVSGLIPLAGYLVTYGVRTGFYVFQAILLLALGAALTTAVCSFTPFCTINFLGFGLNKSQVKEQMAELARTYITPESVNAATVLVSQAIEKYAALQLEKDAREEARYISKVSK